jgi:hypothetical protein
MQLCNSVRYIPSSGSETAYARISDAIIGGLGHVDEVVLVVETHG